MGCCSIFFMALVAILAILSPNIYRLLLVLDTFKTLPTIPDQNGEKCNVVHKDSSGKEWAANGFEDVVYISHDSAISCAGSLHDLWHVTGDTEKDQNKVDHTPQTECVIIRMREGDAPQITTLEMVGYPTELVFFAHGLSIFRPTNSAKKEDIIQVFAINHAYNKGGERIDAFELNPKLNSLAYLGTVKSELLRNEYRGITNDVTVINDNELLLTTWLHDQQNGRGKAAATTLTEKMALPLTYMRTLSSTLDTKIIHCFYNLELNHADAKIPFGASKCKEVKGGFQIANGMTHLRIPTGSIGAAGEEKEYPTVIVMTDVLAKKLFFYSLPRDTTPSAALDNHPELKEVGSVDLEHAVDNIELDPASVTITKTSTAASGEVQQVDVAATFYLGSIVNMGQASKLQTKPDLVSPGATTRFDVKLRFARNATNDNAIEAAVVEGSTTLQDLAIHSGVDFQGTASGLRLLSDPKKKGVENGIVIMGSYMKHGLMICPMPKY